MLHSYRNASSGSTFPARRTGIQHARSPTPKNNAPTTINVAGWIARLHLEEEGPQHSRQNHRQRYAAKDTTCYQPESFA